MHTKSLSTLWTALSFGFVLATSALADERYSAAAAWDFDSVNPVHPMETANQVSGQQVYATMVRMNDLWNAHDLEGYLDAFWRSPALLVVQDGAVINGWKELHDRYVRGFNNPNTMGHGTISRIQVRLLSADSALALEHWTVAFTGSSHVVVGIDTSYLNRVDGVWKVMISHSSYLEM